MTIATTDNSTATIGQNMRINKSEQWQKEKILKRKLRKSFFNDEMKKTTKKLKGNENTSI